MRVPWQLKLTPPSLIRRAHRRGIVDRLDLAARELDDRAAAMLGNGLVRSDRELRATFLRVGSRPTVRR